MKSKFSWVLLKDGYWNTSWPCLHNGNIRKKLPHALFCTSFYSIKVTCLKGSVRKHCIFTTDMLPSMCFTPSEKLPKIKTEVYNKNMVWKEDTGLRKWTWTVLFHIFCYVALGKSCSYYRFQLFLYKMKLFTK